MSYKGKKILAIIPARGGSKGLPGKNIKELCGKPLIAYAIDSIKDSIYDIDIVVSTDSKVIAKVAADFGAPTVKRPDELATDTALVKDSMIYTLEYLKKQGQIYDCVLLIEPTSPLRDSKDIDDVINLYLSDDSIDCIATFSKLEHPVTRLWKIDNHTPKVFIDGANPFKPRQEQEYGYYINGLVYLFKVSTLMNNKTDSLFVGKQSAIITNKHVIDIDTEFDFIMAEHIINYINNKKKK